MILFRKTLLLFLVMCATPAPPAVALSCVWPDGYELPPQDMTERDRDRLFNQSLVDWLFPLRQDEVIVHGVFTRVHADRPFQHQLEHAARQLRTEGTYPPEHEVEAQVDYRYFGKVRFQGGIWRNAGEWIPVDTQRTVLTLSVSEGIVGGRLPPPFGGVPVVGRMRHTTGQWAFHATLGPPCPSFAELSFDSLARLMACRNDPTAC